MKPDSRMLNDQNRSLRSLYLLHHAKAHLLFALAAPLSLGALGCFAPASVSVPRLLIAALCLWPFAALLLISARLVDDWQDWEKDSTAGKELGASKKALGIMAGFSLLVPAAVALLFAPLAAAALAAYAAVLLFPGQLLPAQLRYLKSLLSAAAASAVFGLFSQALIGRTAGLVLFIFCGLWLCALFFSYRNIKNTILKLGLLITLLGLPLLVRGVYQ